MGRNRSQSRSPERRKKRDKDREREKDRDRHRHDRPSHKSERSSGASSSKRSKSRSLTRSRSRSPRHRREVRKPSPARSPNHFVGLTLGNLKPKKSGDVSMIPNPVVLDPKAVEGKTNDEIEMLKVMGFSGFETTKGVHVEGACNAHGVDIQQKRRYRQYMNRKGGFNRPLDPIA